jgi:hypothetical protein
MISKDLINRKKFNEIKYICIKQLLFFYGQHYIKI